MEGVEKVIECRQFYMKYLDKFLINASRVGGEALPLEQHIISTYRIILISPSSRAKNKKLPQEIWIFLKFSQENFNFLIVLMNILKNYPKFKGFSK